MTCDCDSWKVGRPGDEGVGASCATVTLEPLATVPVVLDIAANGGGSVSVENGGGFSLELAPWYAVELEP
jgi:hypothetical protein